MLLQQPVVLRGDRLGLLFHGLKLHPGMVQICTQSTVTSTIKAIQQRHHLH